MSVRLANNNNNKKRQTAREKKKQKHGQTHNIESKSLSA